ncbi:MAG: hypothetical protein LQ339_004493 [Xanthoria mediterranea]|nr:MAG: hypothetical protein LQ339_004493 [Xanthoria mediterranea]
MVVFFQEWCPPWVLHAYSTVALTPNLISLVQHDFNVGTFAQFGDPSEVVRINYRTDFHHMSHLAIRQHLDAENFTDPFILIDEHTAQSHAVWWVTTTEDSEDLTARWYPTVTHPGEDFTLWQSHILIQDLPYQFQLLSGGSIFLEDMIPGERYDPYDPHDPQEPPFTEGSDYATSDGARGVCRPAVINANYSEIMYTADPAITHRMGNPPPQGAVALTPEAAQLSGLVSPPPGMPYVSQWSYWFYDDPPRPGQVIRLNAEYDWDSPRWPPPGVAGRFLGPPGSLPLAGGISRRPQGRPGQRCVRRNFGKPGLVLPGRNATRVSVIGGIAVA